MKYILITISYIFFEVTSFAQGGSGGHGIPGNDLHSIEDLILLHEDEFDELLSAMDDEYITNIGTKTLASPLIPNGHFYDLVSGVEYVKAKDSNGFILEFVSSPDVRPILEAYNIENLILNGGSFISFDDLVLPN